MNDRLTDLLDEVADDRDRPLGFTTADVVRGGRARQRRRVAAVGGLAAVVTAGLVTTLAVTGQGEAGERPGGFATDPTPSVAPSADATDVASGDPTTAASGEPTPTEQLSGQDAVVDSRCRALAKSPLGDWRLDAQVTDAEGSTATFVSPQGDRWRVCELGYGATEEGVGPRWPLDRTAPDLENVSFDGSASSATLCPKDGPPGCTRRLFTAELPLREGVASVEIETPSGRSVEPELGTATYVVRFVEETDDPLPVLTTTLRDADGAKILTYDLNGLMR